MRGNRNTYGVKLVSALALAGLFAGGVALAAATTVSIGSAGPQPATVTIQWGDTVTFKNDDARPHGITIPRVVQASPLIQPGTTWTRVFDGRAGNYGYRQTEGRSFLGSIVVELKGKVTLKATPTNVVYGKRVTFSGEAPAGYAVTVEQLVLADAGQWEQVALVNAGADGKWSTSLAPKLGARFRATAAAGQLRAPAVSIRMQPTLSLVRPRGARAGKLVTVRGRIAPAGVATAADLERYDAERRRWVREDRRKVGRSGAVSFRWKAVKGRQQLRVQVQRFALKPGFQPGTSKPVFVTVSR
ncbi:MAG: cupredoxin domain-containing protein [Gaiellaceae bacterium]